MIAVYVGGGLHGPPHAADPNEGVRAPYSSLGYFVTRCGIKYAEEKNERELFADVAKSVTVLLSTGVCKRCSAIVAKDAAP